MLILFLIIIIAELILFIINYFCFTRHKYERYIQGYYENDDEITIVWARREIPYHLEFETINKKTHLISYEDIDMDLDKK